MLHHAEYQAAQLGLTITAPEDQPQLGHEDDEPEQDWCVCAKSIKDQKFDKVHEFLEQWATSILFQEREPLPDFPFLSYRFEIRTLTDETFVEKKSTKQWKPFPATYKENLLCEYMIKGLINECEGNVKAARSLLQELMDKHSIAGGPLKITEREQQYLWDAFGDALLA